MHDEEKRKEKRTLKEAAEMGHKGHEGGRRECVRRFGEEERKHGGKTREVNETKIETEMKDTGTKERKES